MKEWLHSLRLRVYALLRRRRLDEDLRDEMAFHIAMREAQLGNAGAADANRQARRRFGNTTRISEELRDRWAVAPRLASLGQDVRYAGRALRRQPGFALVVILTLGAGIGVNTATFSIVNAVLIRPLGFPEAERLVAVREELAGFEGLGATFSPPDFLDVEREQQSFTAIGAYRTIELELSGGEVPVLLEAARVSPGLFTVLGVGPVLGRGITSEDARPGVDVAVLSWRLWQARFGGDPSIVGRMVSLDRRPVNVVGVMPSAFEFPRRGLQVNNRPADVWLPLAFAPQQRENRGNEYVYSVVARLKPGVTLEQSQSELAILTQRINDRYPPLLRSRGFVIDLSVAPLRDALAGRIERPLLLLLGAVALVLLVACANIANLVLSRAAARTREVALRAALGSSRMRLLQLLLAEAMVLSIGGGLLGIALAATLVDALPAAVANTLPAAREVAMDVRVLAFTAVITMATSVMFALIPLVTVDRGVPGPTLQEETARTTPGLRRHRLQSALVVSTVMLACVLLVGAGLFIRSFTALMATEAGFVPERVITAAMALPRAGYATAESVHAFQQRLLMRSSSLPGVRSAALATDLPLESYERRTISPAGVNLAGQAVPRNTNLSWIRGPYFTTLGITLQAGRFFTAVEYLESRDVVIVNERLAKAFWPGEPAIGKRLRWGLDAPENRNRWLTIVGVVGDVADGPLGAEPNIHAWEPFIQFPPFVLNNVPGSFGRHVKLALRTDSDPAALGASVRALIAQLDPHLAIQSVATMDERVSDVVAPRRFSAVTLGAFAAGALLLAAVGLYGLLAFGVAERRREIAVRLALGAAPSAIVRMVVGQGLKLVFAGLLLGVAIAFAAAGMVDSFLYRTASRDVVAFAAVPVVLGAIALVACALPAYRASRVQSLAALRAE